MLGVGCQCILKKSVGKLADNFGISGWGHYLCRPKNKGS
jgi:hypothetical protein